MIQHIVMWKFADEAEGRTREENMEFVRNRLLALPALIGEIRGFEIGRDMLHGAASYDMGLCARFDDMAALERYRVHPDHAAVADYVRRVTTARASLDAAFDDDGHLV